MECTVAAVCLPLQPAKVKTVPDEEEAGVGIKERGAGVARAAQQR